MARRSYEFAEALRRQGALLAERDEEIFNEEISVQPTPVSNATYGLPYEEFVQILEEVNDAQAKRAKDRLELSADGIRASEAAGGESEGENENLRLRNRLQALRGEILAVEALLAEGNRPRGPVCGLSFEVLGEDELNAGGSE
jgi:hypothetical protein